VVPHDSTARGRWSRAQDILLYTSDSIPAVFDSGVFRPLRPVDLAQGTPADIVLHPQSSPTWPQGYFDQTAGALTNEHFERPSQGNQSQRESW
jgi:predicted DNA-binding antitoxin AbrB/MazE fold protein